MEKGVSPLIAEIILIAVVFSIATAVIVVLGGVSFSVRTLDAKLGVDGFEWGSQKLVIHHLKGDVIREAFETCGENFRWKDLVVKKTGREVEPLNLRFNGKRLGYLIYEDMTSAPSGTLKNQATYDPENRWVRLTPVGLGLYGELEYVLNPPPADFVVEFQFWAGGGTGADATWFYAYCENTPLLESSTNTGGYVFAYNEYQDRLELYYNGTLLYFVSKTGIDDGRWHDARIVFDDRAIEMYIDNEYVSRLRYVDYQASSRKNKPLFGWGAREGLFTNEHRVRNLRMYHLKPQVHNFSPGDILEFEIESPLVIGDAITISYLPQNKLLYMNDIS
ncbi:MAG: archaellin/type IV pilin N-terminal domain-containing protein [Candidatus Hadarchaeales archaeon]